MPRVGRKRNSLSLPGDRSPPIAHEPVDSSERVEEGVVAVRSKGVRSVAKTHRRGEVSRLNACPLGDAPREIVEGDIVVGKSSRYLLGVGVPKGGLVHVLDHVLESIRLDE